MAEISVHNARAAGAGQGDWFEGMARVGFVAKGLVYILVGVLAAAAAWGSGAAEGSEGALRSLVDEPFGQVILGAVALGLACYALWRFTSATANPEDHGVGHRLLDAGKAFLHLGLAVEAARMAWPGGGGGGGNEERASHWSARAMAQPVGEVAVGVVGLIVVGYGVAQIYRGFTADLDERLELGRLSVRGRRWVVRLGRAGLAARGVVFGVIGGFLVLAAVQSDPGEARGVGGALRTIEQQAYGPWLIGIVGLGLICYGIYQLVRARYRRIVRPAATTD